MVSDPMALVFPCVVIELLDNAHGRQARNPAVSTSSTGTFHRALNISPVHGNSNNNNRRTAYRSHEQVKPVQLNRVSTASWNAGFNTIPSRVTTRTTHTAARITTCNSQYRNS